MSGLKVGSEITCPKCKKTMVKCVKVPKLGDIISEKFFEPKHHKYKKGDAARCPYDETTYIDHIKGAHIKYKGWSW